MALAVPFDLIRRKMPFELRNCLADSVCANVLIAVRWRAAVEVIAAGDLPAGVVDAGQTAGAIGRDVAFDTIAGTVTDAAAALGAGSARDKRWMGCTAGGAEAGRAFFPVVRQIGVVVDFDDAAGHSTSPLFAVSSDLRFEHCARGQADEPTNPVLAGGHVTFPVGRGTVEG
jgi:hypothetical protein